MTEITERLHVERDALPTSDLDDGLRRVRRVARARRRRNSAVGVAAAGGLLVAGIGAVGLIQSDRTELVVTDTAPAVTTALEGTADTATSVAPDPSPAPGTTDAAPTESGAEPAPVAPSGIPTVGATVLATPVDADRVDVTEQVEAARSDAFFTSWQVPWKGGFLVGSQGSEDVTWPAVISADGRRWEPLVLDAGIQGSSATVVTPDERLVTFGARGVLNEVTPVVSSTTDLENWTVVDVPVTRPPADLPGLVEVTVWPRSIAVNDTGWIVTVENTMRIDTSTLAEQRTGLTITGVSELQSADGIRLVVNPDGEGRGEVLDITWAELEEELGSELLATIRGPQPPEVWTGTWADAAPVRHDIPTNEPESWIDDVVAVDAGFVVVRNVQELQPDAPARERKELVAKVGDTDWVVLDSPVDGDVVSVFPLDGDLGVIVEDADGIIAIHRVDLDSATWTPIDVPGLPPTASWFEASDTSAVIVDAAPEQRFDTEPTTGTVEQDGLRYTWVFDSPISSYEVVSVESGDVLVAESIDIFEVEGSFELAFDHLVGGMGDTTISDPETGEVLMEISAADMAAASPPVSPEYEAPEPEPWIVASADGEAWYVAEAPPESPDRSVSVGSSATVSGDRLLIRTDADDWFVVDLA